MAAARSMPAASPAEFLHDLTQFRHLSNIEAIVLAFPERLRNRLVGREFFDVLRSSHINDLHLMDNRGYNVLVACAHWSAAGDVIAPADNCGFRVSVNIGPHMYVGDTFARLCNRDMPTAPSGLAITEHASGRFICAVRGTPSCVLQRLFWERDPSFAILNTAPGGWDASHSCGDSSCINPLHMTKKPHLENKGQDGCAGGIACGHLPACPMRGQFLP
jgi:hypothetical protein